MNICTNKFNQLLSPIYSRESFPDLKRRYWGCHFWARGYYCVTSGELTEEMIKEYLEHHFEPKVDDNFKTEE